MKIPQNLHIVIYIINVPTILLCNNHPETMKKSWQKSARTHLYRELLAGVKKKSRDPRKCERRGRGQRDLQT